MTSTHSERVVVGVCTYRRPEGLRRTLEHLRLAIASTEGEVRVAVVDNDGKDPRVAAVVQATLVDVDHVLRVEPTPGISAARNALVAEADQWGARYLAMLDDDEWPSASWLSELLAAARRSRAAIVGGPVEAVLPAARAVRLSRWKRYWSVEAQELHGRTFVFCTCNFIANLDHLRDVPRPFFEEAFGLTGGGDTAFFRRLFHAGKTMAWSAQAVVYESIPESRASIRWLRTRKYRVGNHAVRWEEAGSSKARILAKSVGLSFRLPIYPLFRRDRGTPLMGWLLEAEKVRGRWAAHLGTVFTEYARAPAREELRACR
ncbi:MAG: hypothetical protein RL385_1707 [Pseudomonadota bacterium]|jgi:succinoglycan biosynthesis protein ExoM